MTKYKYKVKQISENQFIPVKQECNFFGFPVKEIGIGFHNNEFYLWFDKFFMKKHCSKLTYQEAIDIINNYKAHIEEIEGVLKKPYPIYHNAK